MSFDHTPSAALSAGTHTISRWAIMVFVCGAICASNILSLLNVFGPSTPSSATWQTASMGSGGILAIISSCFFLFSLYSTPGRSSQERIAVLSKLSFATHPENAEVH